MKEILVTGAGGFIGKNLLNALSEEREIHLTTFTKDHDQTYFKSLLNDVDYIYHLAGVNRPQHVEEFNTVNVGLTKDMIDMLTELKMKPTIIMSSSTQATLDNPYGQSKKQAEAILLDYGKHSDAPIYIYRLTNVFGKWCRPNYNSVVATFCYNIARNVDITISDPRKELELVYIDDVVSDFIEILKQNEKSFVTYRTIKPTYKVTLGELAEKIFQLRDLNKTLKTRDFSDNFMKCLYATYVSYVEKQDSNCSKSNNNINF